jgi:hypothetical protein
MASMDDDLSAVRTEGAVVFMPGYVSDIDKTEAHFFDGDSSCLLKGRNRSRR